MKITADTNLLVRALTEDDPKQSRKAQAELRGAALVAIGNASLCELVWVLTQLYRVPPQEVAETIRVLVSSENVSVDRAAVDAGLAVLNSGGDFADGMIAFEGQQLGGETFLSFDKRAVRLLLAQGRSARLLTS